MEIVAYLLIGFIVGRISKLTFYVGPDESKYNKADIGLLRRR